MYKKIKRKDVNKYYKCPMCDKIIRIDNTYHIKRCKQACVDLLKELETTLKGGNFNDREH